ncbi:hypothetical protein FHR87_003858 [Azomonas macrocytogenes]|uniref:Uncharacterized protein n=1 Tax=Azomonas macrocytogenes TaxID=69962 RepID=A0A839T958_AZOMA|nr:hypothetical protein [Azomonas macrocytogenes]
MGFDSLAVVKEAGQHLCLVAAPQPFRRFEPAYADALHTRLAHAHAKTIKLNALFAVQGAESTQEIVLMT